MGVFDCFTSDPVVWCSGNIGKGGGNKSMPFYIHFVLEECQEDCACASATVVYNASRVAHQCHEAAL